MHTYYSDHLTFPLPRGSRFPLGKWSLLRERIIAEGIVPFEHLHPSEPATDNQILLVHSQDYWERVVDGRLSEREVRRIGLGWSPELVERVRHSTGACRSALHAGIAVNLAGGTHHASRDQGQGYCLLNDGVIAIRAMQQESLVRRAMIIDCDVHQGNGTASITAGDPTVYAFSIHAEKNFPLHKTPGDLDIGLPDGTGDEAYLQALEQGLVRSLSEANPDLALYLAGADPWRGDRLGRLALTKAGLARRDRLVFEHCLRRGLPVAIVMAGGYGPIEDTVSIHLATVRIAAQLAKTLNH